MVKLREDKRSPNIGTVRKYLGMPHMAIGRTSVLSLLEKVMLSLSEGRPRGVLAEATGLSDIGGRLLIPLWSTLLFSSCDPAKIAVYRTRKNRLR